MTLLNLFARDLESLVSTVNNFSGFILMNFEIEK